jgi:hypothetical protein
MSTTSSILGPVVGALISGLIGVATVEYRNYRDEVAEIEGWYDQVIRLADQVERETPESYFPEIRGDDKASGTREQKNDMSAAYGKIGDRLRDHIHRAPPEITESVLGPASETARYCQIVDREDLRSGDFIPMVGNAVESADKLQDVAKDAKEDVGLF